MDFEELAACMTAGLDGVRACLIVSRDGLSLGAFPADAETTARRAWDRLQELGDPQRGFVDMGTEIWVMARQGMYAAVAVAGPEAKPGRVLDRIETQLALAAKSGTLEDEASPQEESHRPPRSPMHPEPRLAGEPVPTPELVEQIVRGNESYPQIVHLEPNRAPASLEPSVEEPAQERAEDPPPPRSARDVDRVALAREFGWLLRDEGDD